MLGRLYLLGAGVRGACSLSNRSPILGAGIVSGGRLYAAGPETKI